MKAEELFIKIGNEFFNENLTVQEFEKEPDFKFIGKAMREYARIQIEKDRQKISEEFINQGLVGCYDIINEIPIVLD